MRVLSQRTRKTQLAVHWSRIHQVCPVAHLYSIGVHLVGSHLRLHSHSGGQGSTGPCLQPMSLATLLWPEGLQQPSLSVLTESEKTVSFTKHTINRLSKDACLGEDEPQHYAFILVATGLQSCTPISFLAQVGTTGEIIKCCCTVREPSGTRLVVSPCTMRCQIRALVVRDHSRGTTRSPLVMTISLRDLGSRIRCRSYFLECARQAPKVYCCDRKCLFGCCSVSYPRFSRLQCSVGV